MNNRLIPLTAAALLFAAFVALDFGGSSASASAEAAPLTVGEQMLNAALGETPTPAPSADVVIATEKVAAR